MTKVRDKKWRERRSSPELFTPDCYLVDIIQLPVKNPTLQISSLLIDYEEKGLILRQIAAQKVHSRSAISKLLKKTGAVLRASSRGHGNPSQLKFGYKKELGKVIPHKGEQQIIAAIKDFRTDGLTFRQISQRMTVLRIPSKNGKRTWPPMMVKRILDAKNEEGTNCRPLLL